MPSTSILYYFKLTPLLSGSGTAPLKSALVSVLMDAVALQFVFSLAGSAFLPLNVFPISPAGWLRVSPARAGSSAALPLPGVTQCKSGTKQAGATGTIQSWHTCTIRCASACTLPSHPMWLIPTGRRQRQPPEQQTQPGSGATYYRPNNG